MKNVAVCRADLLGRDFARVILRPAVVLPAFVAAVLGHSFLSRGQSFALTGSLLKTCNAGSRKRKEISKILSSKNGV